MKFLVLGSRGYIGRAVSKALLRHGREAVGLVRNIEGLPSAGVREISFDLTRDDPKQLEGLVGDSIVIDCAWSNGFAHNHESHAVQAAERLAFYNMISHFNPKKIVSLGSMHELGSISGPVSDVVVSSPESEYGKAKVYLREELAGLTESRSIDNLWLRCFYFYGDDIRNHSLWTKILKSDRAGEKDFRLDAGQAKFDFIHVDDAAELILQTSEGSETGVLNLGSGQVSSIKEFLEFFTSDLNLKINLVFDYGANNGNGGVWPDLQRLRKIVNLIEIARPRNFS
jgi:nucleoside-diphosphate-sugar epimerase